MQMQLVQLVLPRVIEPFISTIDFEEDRNKMFLYGGYGLSIFIIYLCYFILWLKIRKTDNRQKIIKSPEGGMFSMMGMMNGDVKYKNQTLRQHDMESLTSTIKSHLFGMAIMLFMYLRSKKPSSLITSSIMGPIGLLNNNLIKSYFFNMKIPRPFKKGGQMGFMQDTLKQAQETIDKVEELKKGGSSGSEGSKSKKASGPKKQQSKIESAKVKIPVNTRGKSQNARKVTKKKKI